MFTLGANVIRIPLAPNAETGDTNDMCNMYANLAVSREKRERIDERQGEWKSRVGPQSDSKVAFQDCNVCDERWNLLQASGPYLGGVPAVGSGYSPYFTAGPLVPALVGHDPGAVPSGLAPALPQQVLPAQKLPRSDRLEVSLHPTTSTLIHEPLTNYFIPSKQ